MLRRSQAPILLIGPDVAVQTAEPSAALVVGVDRAAINLSIVPAIVAWQATFGGLPPRLVEVIGPGDDEEPARQRLDDLAAELAAQHVNASTHVVIADDPVRGLEDAAADLDDAVYVAVSARYTDGRLHWHSTTQQLVAHAAHPVLVVPARAVPAIDPPEAHVVDEHHPFHDRSTVPGDRGPTVARTHLDEPPRGHLDTALPITP